VDAVLTPGAISTLFQPIVNLADPMGEVWAVECLARGPSRSTYDEAETLFRLARRENLEVEIDRACVATALETAQRRRLAVPLFLNVHPETLRRDPRFPAFLAATAERCRVSLTRVTLELVEYGRHLVDGALRRALASLRDLGARIAMDDFGRGPCDHQMLRDCQPHFLKLDGHLWRAARRLPAERRLVAAVLDAVRDRGITPIAEGIEQSLDLDLARSMGVALVQGYLIARPSVDGRVQAGMEIPQR
jgi:EAL domain-containing protein (putative c-di-GMP-specific phosphodiesterase class I)